jgi:hypothetical protein
MELGLATEGESRDIRKDDSSPDWRGRTTGGEAQAEAVHEDFVSIACKFADPAGDHVAGELQRRSGMRSRHVW